MKIIFLISILVFVVNVKATYNEYRCKCICNLPNVSKNVSTLAKKVFVQSVDSENCRCRYMMPDMDEKSCLRCECKYQSRKTKIMEVVVWIVISIISGLTIYMFVLQFIDAICKKKSDANFMIKMNASRSVSSPSAIKIIKQEDKSNAISKKSNEFDNYDDLPFASRDQLQESISEGGDTDFGSITCRKPDEIITPRLRTKSEAMSDVVNRARYEQDRWRGTVKMQRDRVFHDHSILN